MIFILLCAGKMFSLPFAQHTSWSLEWTWSETLGLEHRRERSWTPQKYPLPRKSTSAKKWSRFRSRIAWVLEQSDQAESVPMAELRRLAELGVNVTDVYKDTQCYLKGFFNAIESLSKPKSWQRFEWLVASKDCRWHIISNRGYLRTHLAWIGDCYGAHGAAGVRGRSNQQNSGWGLSSSRMNHWWARKTLWSLVRVVWHGGTTNRVHSSEHCKQVQVLRGRCLRRRLRRGHSISQGHHTQQTRCVVFWVCCRRIYSLGSSKSSESFVEQDQVWLSRRMRSLGLDR